MILELLLIIILVAPLFGLFIGWGRPWVRGMYSLLVALFPLVTLATLYGRTIAVQYAHLPFVGIDLSLRLTPLSWFFGIAVAAIGLFALVYSFSYMKDQKRLDLYYFLFLLVNAGILGVVLSGDLFTFYILWEIMSIATFLSISFRGGKALPAGLKYIVFSVVGSSAMLIAIVSLYVSFGMVDIVALATALSGATVGYAIFILVMFSLAFGIKNGLLPLHPWLPDAYTESPTPFTVVLGGMLTRLGVYGFLVVMYGMIGLPLVQRMSFGPVNYGIILAWIAGITILFGVFVAVFHDDAKRILAWSSIGHGGYMILGLALAGSLTLAGGIFHALNYAMSVSLLFLAVGAVEYRTGTCDLTQLGGLCTRMPVTFIASLIAVFGMIGVPLTSGFVSKWLLYKGLILDGHPFLAFIALVGTWGTVLYGYKVVHNVFLGQVPEQYREVKEVSWTMRAPMIVLSSLIVLFGVLPGMPLKAVSAIQTHLGVTPLDTRLFGVPKALGELNTLNIFFAVLAAGLVGYGVFSLARRSKRVSQYDNYAAGARVPVGQYQHSVKFYDQADRVIRPYLRDRIDDFYAWIAGVSTDFFEQLRKIYTGNVNTYATWIVLFVAVLIFMGLLGWKP